MGINWLGNTRVVAKTKVESLPNFPELKQRKAGRVVTKHFANLTYTLHPKYISLLSFLIYQAKADNTIQYTSTLNLSYEKAIELARKSSGYGEHEINTSKPTFRNQINKLIKYGLLLPTPSEAMFLINPALTYNRQFIPKRYFDEFVINYNRIRKTTNINNLHTEILSLTGSYMEFVANEGKRHHKEAQIIQ